MQKSHLHAYNAKGNLSGISVILGIIGLAINPLLGIAGAWLGSLGWSKRADERIRQMKTEYHVYNFWEK